MAVKILKPSLDDLGQTTVLRGIVDRASLPELRNDFYQREKLPVSSRRDIILALESGTQLPDIELGMRGETWAVADDNSVMLHDPVFIIDGRQRTETLKDFLETWPEAKAHLGAIVHFGTNASWERARFHTLNTSRVKVAPSVLLRNIKDDNPGLAVLYGLSQTQRDFPLYSRVCWRQTRASDELVSALAYTRTVARLHAHLAPARHVSGGPAQLAAVMNRIIERIGLPMLRENAVTLWTLIDQAWGLKEIRRGGSVPYLHTSFLQVLVDVLSDHVDFWQQPDELRLVIPYELKRKLTNFPVYDPEVMRLSAAAGKAMEALYFIMMTHINSGKRTRRLVPRNARANIPAIVAIDDGETEDDEEGAAA